MAPRRHAQDSPTQRQSQGSHSTASAGSDEPRRRRLDIQDLLNPVGTDNDSGLRCPSQLRHHARRYQRRQWSRQSSLGYDSHASSGSGSSRSSSSGRRSPPRGRTSREFRPTYSEEEINFIWYYRIDLGWEWREVLDAFSEQFPNRQRRDVGGIQCKYYRHLESYGIPQVRQRDRKVSAVEQYGMRARTGLWYPWMR
ncbi:MAG: hypothetical protein Q9179_004320 [Wetmoreana sp. 5 TL-2023]